VAIKHVEEYRDPRIAQKILDDIVKSSTRPIRLMEVCGTHTVSIFRSGIRTILPGNITLLSGPGCPVCVTAQREIDSFIELAKSDDVILVTFGDLMRVPGTVSSLQKERSEGHDIRMVYSAMDALQIAEKNPNKKVVFLGVGFETTAPTIALTLLTAQTKNIGYYFVYSAHKLVPPALTALIENNEVNVDGFILPGHVSIIIGARGYMDFFNRYSIPCVVAGFEPADILQAILELVRQVETNRPVLENSYRRAVTFEGNLKAQKVMADVFEIRDTSWRGIGIIPMSGIKIREEFAAFDAEKVFDFRIPESEDPKGCACGQILCGVKIPPECALYQKACTPENPVGPCMVSSEGTCAAYYRYHRV